MILNHILESSGFIHSKGECLWWLAFQALNKKLSTLNTVPRLIPSLTLLRTEVRAPQWSVRSTARESFHGLRDAVQRRHQRDLDEQFLNAATGR